MNSLPSEQYHTYTDTCLCVFSVLASFLDSPDLTSSEVGLIVEDIRRLRQSPPLDVLRRQIGRADGADGGESRYRSSAGGIIRGGRLRRCLRKNI